MRVVEQFSSNRVRGVFVMDPLPPPPPPRPRLPPTAAAAKAAAKAAAAALPRSRAKADDDDVDKRANEGKVEMLSKVVPLARTSPLDLDGVGVDNDDRQPCGGSDEDEDDDGIDGG